MAGILSGGRAPARFWGALFVAAAGSLPAGAAPPNTAPPPEYLQTGTLDAATGRQVLAESREAGPARPYYLEFVLRQLPRRGPERDTPGRLWMSRDEGGLICRAEINPGTPNERRFLLQRGQDSSVWLYDPGTHAGPARQVTPSEPLAPGLEITAFDLEMPFLYWPDARPVSVNRVLGRPTDLFVFVPPAAAALQMPQLAAVRAYLDSEHHVPVQIESLDRGGRVWKTLSLVGLKEVSHEWLPQDIDIRNEATRDKTRFSVTAAAIGLDFSPALFSSAVLSDPVSPPAAGRIIRFNP
jgi:hypothetical protein